MINRLLNYIEIKTKITSVLTFMMFLVYLFYREASINWLATGVFFVSMFLFDLTTTAINNYIDTKTNDQILQFSRKTALHIIIVLLILSTISGIYLVILSDVVILLIGALCFACGIFYTFGPLPISRMPLGEILSGIFYGLLIPFILLYLNMPAGTYVSLSLTNWHIALDLNVIPLIELFLLSVAPMACTANIMLANNVCDLEKDIAVKRHTLPYYLGVKRSLYLFAALYYVIYLDMILLVILEILPPVCLIFLLTIIPVRTNIKLLFRKQIKAETFIASIRNFVIIMLAQILVVSVACLIK